MQNKSILKHYLIDIIGNTNFETYFTSKKRFLFHLSMWLIFASLLFLSYYIAYHLTIFYSLILTLRMSIVNMTIFYIFFYGVVPKLLNKRIGVVIIYLVILLPLLMILWLLITYVFSLIYHYLGLEIESGELRGAITGSAKQTFWEAISLSRIISQSFIVISVLSPFFFVKILMEIFKMYSKMLQVQRQRNELEIQNINIEKDFLKSQLNPHFLFNTLNNLYSLSLKKDDKVPEVILNLSETMSYTLYESNSDKVPLYKEIEFIRNYVELEKMRYSSNKYIQFEFPNETECSGKFIAPLLTFSYVENAFKYGLKENTNSFIKLKIKVIGTIFYFELENDVDKNKTQAEHGGIGLENSRKRLQLIYPNKHRLNIKNEASYFKVNLELNLDLNEKN